MRSSKYSKSAAPSMPRSFAQFKTSIWNPDDDFCKLAVAAQQVYFMLSSQSDITAAGTLPLTIKRWARHSADATPETVTAALQLLVDARYVVIDHDTEELLIRTFIKADNGYGNDKRRGAIKDSAVAVASPMLKAVIADELEKLGLTQIALAVSPDRASKAHAMPYPAVDNPAQEGASQNPRVGVTQVELVVTATPKPQPATLIPESATPEGEPSPRVDDPSSKFCPKHQPDGTDEPCGPCRGRRERIEKRLSQRAQAEADRRSAGARARADCPDCNTDGWIEDADHKPLRRCGHPRLVAQPESRTA